MSVSGNGGDAPAIGRERAMVEARLEQRLRLVAEMLERAATEVRQALQNVEQLQKKMEESNDRGQ